MLGLGVLLLLGALVASLFGYGLANEIVRIIVYVGVALIVVDILVYLVTRFGSLGK